MNANRILFAGMHESGKTTFIAALWDYINSDKQNKKLNLTSLANSENQYLEKIRGEWLQCKKVSRTNLNDSETVVMNVTEVATSNNIILEIPDISGELFNTHFQMREWELDFDRIINQMAGILLFINPKDKRNRTQYIQDALAIEFEINDEVEIQLGEVLEASKNALKREETEKDFVTWSEEHTSNQVKLVETFQFIADRIDIKIPIRVSIIVSRWDLMDVNGGVLPNSWFKFNMPLLYQYLICNQDIFQINVYGVSAQGGDYSKDEERQVLLGIDPHERPKVKLDSVFINDITAPITWLTEK